MSIGQFPNRKHFKDFTNDLKIYFGKGTTRVCLDVEHAEDMALVEALRPLLQEKEVFIEIELGMGTFTERVWGCDLSEGYVAENAYYTT